MRSAIMMAAILMTACGQTGSLYLPDDAVETPVEIKTPEASEPKEAEKKKDEPPGR